MKSNKEIIYTGDLYELYSLVNEKEDLDNNKLLEWLLKSKNISCDPYVKEKIKKIVRKNKINHINNNDK